MMMLMTMMAAVSVFTIFLTHGTEWRIAVNKGMGESSGFMGDTSVKTVERESVKQLCTNTVKLSQPGSKKTQHASKHGTWRQDRKIHGDGSSNDDNEIDVNDFAVNGDFH